MDSEHFSPAIIKFENLFSELDNFLQSYEWLAGDKYSLADAAYTPYLTRIEHLNLIDLIEKRKNLKNWYSKIKDRANYNLAISKWINQDYLDLMLEKGSEAKNKIRSTPIRHIYLSDKYWKGLIFMVASEDT